MNASHSFVCVWLVVTVHSLCFLISFSLYFSSLSPPPFGAPLLLCFCHHYDSATKLSAFLFFSQNFGPLVNIGHCSTLALLFQNASPFSYIPPLAPPLSLFFFFCTHTHTLIPNIQIHLSFVLSYLLMYNCWFIELKTYLISNVID